jgi:acetate kinase
MKADRSKCILVINGGSSSLKFSLFQAVSFKLQLSGTIKHIGSGKSYLKIVRKDGTIYTNDTRSCKTVADGAKTVVKWLKDNVELGQMAAIGHRLVQGGTTHRAPERITDPVLQDLQNFVYLAPNHLPSWFNR